MTKEEFRRIRVELSLTQADLARFLGYKTDSAVCRIEAGDSAVTPSVAKLMSLLRDSRGLILSLNSTQWRKVAKWVDQEFSGKGLDDSYHRE